MHKQALALFDFDGSMIAGDSIIPFLRYAIRSGRLSALDLPMQLINALLGLWGLKAADEAKSRALRFLGSMDAADITPFCLRFCQDELMPGLYPKALDRLEQHRREGLRLLLISASPDIYLRHMGPLMGFDAVLASPTNEQGQVISNTRGEQKPLRLQAWLKEQGLAADYAASYAYGDSASDLPLMQLCGHPVMVNPKRAMQRAAAGLPVEHWHR